MYMNPNVEYYPPDQHLQDVTVDEDSWLETTPKHCERGSG